MAERPASRDDSASLPVERYRADGVLGQGGMGTVYAVTELATGRKLALKRPRLEPASSARRLRAGEQLHREYNLLAELSHPSIIRVFDYGVDAGGAYYTMELLSGPSLAAEGVLDWRRACEIARDVASSLAVIHARRLVHRDVTLRNIHFDADQQRYKLLDFGAVMSRGVATRVVGTPPYMPPQAFARTPLDGRTDLYALGACLYRLLTGTHAFPAHGTDELPALWQQQRPLPPHARNPDVPVPLGELTMALLSLDPLARPRTAAEVMDRLSALAGLEVREPPAVRRAYLITPTLVGRSRALQQVRAFAARGAQGGGLLMVSGPSGVGKSRIVDACAAQARALGMDALQAVAGDTATPYAVAHALLEAALRARPEARQTADTSRLRALLGPSSERESAGESGSGASEQRRREALQLFRRFFAELARARPLLLAVDDIERADEPSAALLVGLSEDARGMPLSLALSAASDREPHAAEAVRWLERAGSRIELANLTAEEVLELLRSVFGDAPNVRLLADRIYAISGGHPSWVMQLAEHLVERGLVRYEAGAFILPERLELEHIPSTWSAVLLATLDGSSPAARALAHAFMLEPDAWFSARELQDAAVVAAQDVPPALDELQQAGVLAREGRRYGLSRHALARVMRERADDELRAAWHRRLARVFELRGDEPRAAQHLWSAGEREATVELLVRWGTVLSGELASDSVALDRAIATMPPGFLTTLSHAVDASIELGRPKHDELILRCACVHVGATTFDGDELLHLHALLAQLRVDAGLEAWEQLADIVDPGERLARALAATEQRYRALPQAERGFESREARRLLALMVGHGTAVCSQARDFRLAAALPSLAPLLPLSPELAVIEELVCSVRHFMAGRTQPFRAGYLRVLELLDDPTIPEGDATVRRFVQLAIWFTFGMNAAEFGDEQGLRWADRLEREPMFEVAAWRVRHCYHRVLGDSEEAERCRRKSELLRIQNRPYRHLAAVGLMSDEIYALVSEDLMTVKRVAQELEPVAERFDGWKPALAVMRAEHARLRGEPREALALFEHAHALADEHAPPLAATAMSGRLAVLAALGRLDEARSLAQRWLAELAAAQMGEGLAGISNWLALIDAGLGLREPAVARIDAYVRALEGFSVRGLHMFVAYELRARVALLLGDETDFEAARARGARQLERSRDPALWARYQRLLRDARERGLSVPDARAPEGSDEDAAVHAASGGDEAALRAALAACAGADARARCLLAALAQDCDAGSGLLYLAANGGMRLRASFGRARAGEALALPALELGAAGGPLDEAGRGGERPEVTADAAPQALDGTYRSFLLRDERRDDTWLVGVVLLDAGDELHAGPRARLLQLAAEALLDHGDCQPLPLR